MSLRCSLRALWILGSKKMSPLQGGEWIKVHGGDPDVGNLFNHSLWYKSGLGCWYPIHTGFAAQKRFRVSAICSIIAFGIKAVQQHRYPIHTGFAVQKDSNGVSNLFNQGLWQKELHRSVILVAKCYAHPSAASQRHLKIISLRSIG